MQESHIEKCYRVPEIAKAWQLSEDTVRKVFRDEPGVILIGHGELLHKRPRFYSVRPGVRFRACQAKTIGTVKRLCIGRVGNKGG